MLRRLLIGTAVLVALAVVGVAWATIPSKDGTISACYSKLTGVVRVIDPTTDKCQRWENPISWSQSGALAVVGRTVATTVTLAPGESRSFASQCLEGEVAINGFPTGWIPGLAVTASSQFFDGTHPSGWLIEFRNDRTKDATETIGTIALCARGTMAMPPSGD